jgi:hypothetical protein
MSDADFANRGFGEVQAVRQWPIEEIIDFHEQGTVRVTVILRAQRGDQWLEGLRCIESADSR